MANATAQPVLASLDYPGSGAGPHSGAGVQAAQGRQAMPVKGARVVSQLPPCSHARCHPGLGGGCRSPGGCHCPRGAARLQAFSWFLKWWFITCVCALNGALQIFFGVHMVMPAIL